MLRSMTGYGRGVWVEKTGRLTVEIQSVNRKFFDVAVFLPRELARWEVELKKWVLPYASRGQITVRVTAVFCEEGLSRLIPQTSLFYQLREVAQTLAEKCGVAPEVLFLALVQKTDGLLLVEENVEL